MCRSPSPLLPSVSLQMVFLFFFLATMTSPTAWQSHFLWKMSHSLQPQLNESWAHSSHITPQCTDCLIHPSTHDVCTHSLYSLLGRSRRHRRPCSQRQLDRQTETIPASLEEERPSEGKRRRRERSRPRATPAPPPPRLQRADSLLSSFGRWAPPPERNGGGGRGSAGIGFSIHF